jgi:hypothetical protein
MSLESLLGREFSYELLRAVSRRPEDELQSSLARLVASALVLQRGTPKAGDRRLHLRGVGTLSSRRCLETALISINGTRR